MTDNLRDIVVGQGMMISKKIAARPIPEMGGGMGVVAVENIAEDERLVSVPPHLFLHSALCRGVLGHVSNDLVAKLRDQPPMLTITIALLLLRHCPTLRSNVLRDDRFPHLPTLVQWIDILPSAYDNLLEAHDWEVDVFSIPRYRSKVIEERQRLEYIFSTIIIPIIGRDALANNEELAAAFTKQNYLWAYNSLMSRGFSYDRPGHGPGSSDIGGAPCANDGTWAMMPWVDFVNYSTEPNVTMGQTAATGYFDFVSTKPIPAGSQLFLIYGIYNDFELAMWYGFTLCSTNGGHQANCSYCFSPLADPNGEYPSSNAWVTELECAIAAKYPHIVAFGAVKPSVKFHDVRVSRSGCSQGMSKLLAELRRLRKPVAGAKVANALKYGGDILQWMCAVELDAIRHAEEQYRQQAARACSEATSIAGRWMKSIEEDSKGILEYVVSLTAAEADRLVVLQL